MMVLASQCLCFPVRQPCFKSIFQNIIFSYYKYYIDQCIIIFKIVSYCLDLFVLVDVYSVKINGSFGTFPISLREEIHEQFPVESTKSNDYEQL